MERVALSVPARQTGILNGRKRIMKSMLLGVTWYRGKEDFDRLKAMAKDSEVLPDTYEKWLQGAEDVFGQMTLRGFTVVKVYLDPETFPARCQANGYEIDGAARSRYGSEFALRSYKT
jgi:hypothetical protein